EPGVFSMGDDSGKYDDEKPQFDCAITQPYALARFPVTNRQYLAFLDDLERQGKHDEARKRRPRTWPGRRYRPGSGSHPVAAVSWYAATAYAEWLDAALRERGFLSPEEAVRLPTEPEWERAAAYPVVLPAKSTHTERRDYPWGAWPAAAADEDSDEVIRRAALCANTVESGIGDTSPVGIFPQGAAACGAEELAGNVFEWCATAYQKYPLPGDMVRETLDTVSQKRAYVLRGGSWYFDRDLARCVYRDGSNPGYVYGHRGFRLARLFSSSSSS
ncbi:MAG: hypothetical protein EOM24_37320, partial [Chloroflexia bacterium]|nr:hypothetical protein [Chloroflexia bacterium]